MKKKMLYLFLILVIGCVAFFMNRSNIETDASIKDNSGLSLSYLSQEEETPVLKVFNFDKEQVVKHFKLKEEKDLYSISYFNHEEGKTLITIQQTDPYGYQVYLQDENQFRKLGLIKERVHEALYYKGFLYAAVYGKQDTGVTLNKYDVNDLQSPVKTWNIKGYPERLLVNPDTNTIYILSVTDQTLLYSVNTKSEILESVMLLEKGYDLNAYIQKDKLWLLLRETLNNTTLLKKNEQQDVKSVLVYNLNEGKKEKEFTTKHQPKFIHLDDEQIYLITGSANSSFLEVYKNEEEMHAEGIAKIKANVVNGFIGSQHNRYIFTDNGILKVKKDKTERVMKENIPPNVDLLIR